MGGSDKRVRAAMEREQEIIEINEEGNVTLKFVIPAPPRTKKTHQRIVRTGPRPKILPSKQYEEWFRSAMWHAIEIRRDLSEAGVLLPIIGPVSVCALFYRDAEIGDATGYYQALGDWLQSPIKTASGKVRRNGAGIILDDRQIRDWDGSRLLKDRDNPRIEVVITMLNGENT